jgi:hypothetical protein
MQKHNKQASRDHSTAVEELRKKERQDETQFTTEMQRGAYF